MLAPCEFVIVSEDNDDTVSLSSSVCAQGTVTVCTLEGCLQLGLRQVPGRHGGTEKSGPNVQGVGTECLSVPSGLCKRGYLWSRRG